MIKLTREEDAFLERFCISNEHLKADLIELLYDPFCELSETFGTDESKLKAIQAILDGKWEVEEQLYYVRNNIGASLLKKVNGEVVTSMPHARFFTDNKEEFQLTKREVASYDKRYLEFLEEVE